MTVTMSDMYPREQGYQPLASLPMIPMGHYIAAKWSPACWGHEFGVNETEYGLVSYAFSFDLNRAHRLIDCLETK
jgi:hypothetical protein